MIISRRILRRMRDVSDKIVEEIKTRFLCSITFISGNRAVYEIMWKKYDSGRQATDDNITRRMRFACWITKATDTHPERVILVASPLHQWFREQRLNVVFIRTLPFLFRLFSHM